MRYADGRFHYSPRTIPEEEAHSPVQMATWPGRKPKVLRQTHFSLHHGKMISFVDEGHQFPVQLLHTGNDHMVRPAARVRLCTLGDARRIAAVGKAEGNQQVSFRPALRPPPRRGGHGKHMAVAEGNLCLRCFDGHIRIGCRQLFPKGDIQRQHLWPAVKKDVYKRQRLGLVRPRRAQNGYRIYDLNDIYRLTIIRDLRGLGFSMERIGEYLQGLSVENTLQLLEEERRLIRERIRDLRAAERAIRARSAALTDYARMDEGAICLIELPARPCLCLNADIARDEEMDFAIKRLHYRHVDTIRDLGGQKIGAKMCIRDRRCTVRPGRARPPP